MPKNKTSSEENQYLVSNQGGHKSACTVAEKLARGLKLLEIRAIILAVSWENLLFLSYAKTKAQISALVFARIYII